MQKKKMNKKSCPELYVDINEVRPYWDKFH